MSTAFDPSGWESAFLIFIRRLHGRHAIPQRSILQNPSAEVRAIFFRYTSYFHGVVFSALFSLSQNLALSPNCQALDPLAFSRAFPSLYSAGCVLRVPRLLESEKFLLQHVGDSSYPLPSNLFKSLGFVPNFNFSAPFPLTYVVNIPAPPPFPLTSRMRIGRTSVPCPIELFSFSPP